jgi:L-tartrate/succinate antiporter
MRTIYARALAPVTLSLLIAVFPTPGGLERNAWLFFAVFAGIVLGLILEPIPSAAIAFVGVFLAASLGLVDGKPADSVRWALSGFSNTTVWLIFGAFMFALGYEKTGLGKRLGLLLVKALGRRTLGLGYAVALADLVLAPFIPSNTARSAGTIYPVVRNLPGLFGSFPGTTARRAGAYLMWTAFASTCITSSMFVTALAPNLLALEMANKTVGFTVGWTEWFLGFAPVGIPLILTLPLLTYWLYPPELRLCPDAQSWASEELAKMGRMSNKELMMAILAAVALAIWVLGSGRIDATTGAGIVISAMVISGVVTWEEIVANKQAWNALVWFGALVALADGLHKVGFVTWVASRTAAHLTGMPPVAVMMVLVALFFFVHYMFASLTAHTTAILPVILAAGSAVPGLPMKPFALLLCFSLGIMGVITPYATGPAPVYYGSGYVTRREFWGLGFVFGAIFLLALLGIGTPYLLSRRF